MLPEPLIATSVPGVLVVVVLEAFLAEANAGATKDAPATQAAAVAKRANFMDFSFELSTGKLCISFFVLRQEVKI
jgi:hypothetical protein